MRSITVKLIYFSPQSHDFFLVDLYSGSTYSPTLHLYQKTRTVLAAQLLLEILLVDSLSVSRALCHCHIVRVQRILPHSIEPLYVDEHSIRCTSNFYIITCTGIYTLFLILAFWIYAPWYSARIISSPRITLSCIQFHN